MRIDTPVIIFLEYLYVGCKFLGHLQFHIVAAVDVELKDELCMLANAHLLCIGLQRVEKGIEHDVLRLYGQCHKDEKQCSYIFEYSLHRLLYFECVMLNCVVQKGLARLLRSLGRYALKQNPRGFAAMYP